MGTIVVREKRSKSMAKKQGPPKDSTSGDDGSKLTSQAKLELPKEEFERVREAAKKRGLPIASFVRMAVLKETERVEQGRD